jgi:hypothetical protein
MPVYPESSLAARLSLSAPSVIWYATMPSGRDAGLEDRGELLALDTYRLRGVADDQCEQAEGLDDAQDFVVGLEMAKVKHALVEVLALSWLEEVRDGIE